MSEEILPLDEVERIAKEFVRIQWNAEVTKFERIWPSSDRRQYEVEGKAKIPQRVATGEPKRLPNNAPFYETDVVYMDCLFKLRVSVKNREVIGYRIEQPKPPPPSSHFYPPIGPDAEIISPKSLREIHGIDVEKEADTRRKKAETESKEAEAYLLGELEKEVRDSRDKEELLKKCGYDGKKAKDLRDKLGW